MYLRIAIYERKCICVYFVSMYVLNICTYICTYILYLGMYLCVCMYLCMYAYRYVCVYDYILSMHESI